MNTETERPVEPSDSERSEWPDATREYVEYLESQEDKLNGYIWALRAAVQHDDSPINPDGLIAHAMQSTPDACLAQHDAGVVADALETLLPLAKSGQDDFMVETIEANIKHLRRKAGD